MSKRGWIIAFMTIIAIVLAGLVYVAGLSYPFDVEGEGPWPENYR